MADKYPRISRDGIRLWLEDPTTQSFLKTLEWYQDQLGDVRRNATFVGDTNDKTAENLFRNLGATQAAEDFKNPMRILEQYELVKEEVA